MPELKSLTRLGSSTLMNTGNCVRVMKLHMAHMDGIAYIHPNFRFCFNLIDYGTTMMIPSMKAT